MVGRDMVDRDMIGRDMVGRCLLPFESVDSSCPASSCPAASRPALSRPALSERKKHFFRGIPPAEKPLLMTVEDERVEGGAVRGEAVGQGIADEGADLAVEVVLVGDLLAGGEL